MIHFSIVAFWRVQEVIDVRGPRRVIKSKALTKLLSRSPRLYWSRLILRTWSLSLAWVLRLIVTFPSTAVTCFSVRRGGYLIFRQL